MDEVLWASDFASASFAICFIDWKMSLQRRSAIELRIHPPELRSLLQIRLLPKVHSLSPQAHSPSQIQALRLKPRSLRYSILYRRPTVFRGFVHVTGAWCVGERLCWVFLRRRFAPSSGTVPAKEKPEANPFRKVVLNPSISRLSKPAKPFPPRKSRPR